MDEDYICPECELLTTVLISVEGYELGKPYLVCAGCADKINHGADYYPYATQAH